MEIVNSTLVGAWYFGNDTLDCSELGCVYSKEVVVTASKSTQKWVVSGGRFVLNPLWRQWRYSTEFDYAVGLLFAGPMIVVGLMEGGGSAALAGREWSLGSKFRLAPFGNRTGHPYGRFPHYHRRGEGPDQGMVRHRPWEPKKTDTTFWDRF